MGYCRARLTPFGRKLLVDRIVELGWPVTQAAESVGVSRQTAYRWLKRFEEEGRGRTGGSFLPASPQSGSGFSSRWRDRSWLTGSENGKALI